MKLAREINILILTLAALFTVSCSNNEIEIDKLAKIYVDLAVVEDYYNSTDSIKIKSDEIFKKYGVDENSYKESFVRFGADKEKWDQFYSIANSYLDTLKSNLKKSPGKTK